MNFIKLITFMLILLFFSCEKNNKILDEEIEFKNKWITKIYDFVPAPGQFQNKLIKKSLLEEAENIIGDNSNFISLGTFGGYIVFGFEDYIKNKEGYDLAIFANSFRGSSEPGIVMVSYDDNKNGLPDDKWYELKGSEHDKIETIKNYQITYFKPKENEDSYKIKYFDNQGKSGILDFNNIKTFHSQKIYPISFADSCTFKGTLLKNNISYEYSSIYNDSLYVWNAYEWGYADNKGYQQTDELRGSDLFDISNAIDENGNSVLLEKVSFIKVYNATLPSEKYGITILGDRSCEIFKAKYLH